MPPPPIQTGTEIGLVFIELGAAVIGLAILARFAVRIGVSAIPLFLLAGLAFGKGGLLPLAISEDFVHVGAEIGVVLLMFMLGLEYTGDQLSASLKTGLPSGVFDLAANFAPGFIVGLLIGWSPLAAFLLGLVTYISSSGIIAKILSELRWSDNPETSTILSILVMEDLAMAGILPVTAALLAGQELSAALTSIGIALLTAAVVLVVAIRYGKAISRVIVHPSNEIVLLSTFGIVLLVAGIAQELQVSAAVGAFLIGIALSGPIVHQATQVLSPLRDLFTTVFFFFFGLQIDPSTLPPVLLVASALGVVSVLTKLLTGWWAARRAGLDPASQLRTGVALVSRGEFSIVIAGLGVSAGIEPLLGPLSAAYVLLLAVIGPLLAQVVVRLSPKNSKGSNDSNSSNGIVNELTS